MINKLVESEFVKASSVLAYFNGLLNKYHTMEGLPKKVNRFASKKAGFARLNKLITQINETLAKEETNKKAREVAKKKPSKKELDKAIKTALDKNVKEKKAKAGKKAGKKKKPGVKVKIGNLRKCIVNKKNGEISPVQTAFKVFDTYYKPLNLTRPDFIGLCEKLGVKGATAAKQWSGKVKEADAKK